MLGLIIVHNQAGVNDARNPAEERQEQAQDETEHATRHQNGDRRERDAKEIAEGFHGK
jgi:hypothetical protein